MLVQVHSLGNDEWSRPLLRNVKTGTMYADINLGMGKPDWHVLTTEGEPLTRIYPHVVFEIVPVRVECDECGNSGDDPDYIGTVCNRCGLGTIKEELCDLSN